jgi:hypothetical protein
VLSSVVGVGTRWGVVREMEEPCEALASAEFEVFCGKAMMMVMAEFSAKTFLPCSGDVMIYSLNSINICPIALQIVGIDRKSSS